MRRRSQPFGTTTLTSKGHITIPVGIRQRLGIHAGAKIAVEIVGEYLRFMLLLPQQRRQVPSQLCHRKEG